MTRHTIGIVGARGYVGKELIRLIAAHPRLRLSFVSSRELAGVAVRDEIPDYGGAVAYEVLGPNDVAERGVDVAVLALPNGKAAPYVAALEQRSSGTIIVDVSADYRFDDAWYYGLPELTRTRYRGERRISNPGCYATAMQLALAPMLALIDGPAQCFGVSGYSGAGTTPSDKNDPDKLRNNLIPYSLSGHLHEREVARQLGTPIEFLPHVAPHFRGITMTVNAHLGEPTTLEAVSQRYADFYAGEPLVRIVEHAPWVNHVAARHRAEIGGFDVSSQGRRLVVVATLDNLLKGAATQALQNLNLALGVPELTGIPHG